jgi:uncharacterized protein YqiB (DUF1249 family)
VSVDLPLTDSLCRVSWRARPRGFIALMTLYESNYIRLRQLSGEFAALPVASVSAPPGDFALHLRVDERSRYTTTLTLTYRFELPDGGQADDPNLQIRVYHDAHLAEALNGVRRHRHPLLSDLQSHAPRHMDARWRRNMMLNKWLDYCTERGHCFAHVP